MTVGELIDAVKDGHITADTELEMWQGTKLVGLGTKNEHWEGKGHIVPILCGQFIENGKVVTLVPGEPQICSCGKDSRHLLFDMPCEPVEVPA
jgi:hypothetical protein